MPVLACWFSSLALTYFPSPFVGEGRVRGPSRYACMRRMRVPCTGEQPRIAFMHATQLFSSTTESAATTVCISTCGDLPPPRVMHFMQRMHKRAPDPTSQTLVTGSCRSSRSLPSFPTCQTATRAVQQPVYRCASPPDYSRPRQIFLGNTPTKDAMSFPFPTASSPLNNWTHPLSRPPFPPQ
jgi:hypothetical protein